MLSTDNQLIYPFKTELPTCEAVQCSLPRNPSNGKAIFTTVAYKSVLTYECNYGYMVVGNATR
jgi:Sushi repeat (SCR repeat)